MIRFKNKTLAAFLALILGTIGAHRFYLEGRKSVLAWGYFSFFVAVGSAGLIYLHRLHTDLGTDFISFLHPALLLAFLPELAACIESLVFALTPDAKWDARWNPHSERKNQSGWPVIVIAILTLGLGATALLSAIAISAQVFAGGSA